MSNDIWGDYQRSVRAKFNGMYDELLERNLKEWKAAQYREYIEKRISTIERKVGIKKPLKQK